MLQKGCWECLERDVHIKRVLDCVMCREGHLNHSGYMCGMP